MRLFSSEVGLGNPIIFLHGFPFDHHLWDLMHDYLHREFRYIFPDLRGFGKSQVDHAAFSMQDMAQDVIELIDRLGIKECMLVGHSMGGYVALQVLRLIPSRVRGIALLASHIYADTNDTKENRYRTIKKMDSLTTSEVFKEMPLKLSAFPLVQAYCANAVECAKPIGLQGALQAMAKRKSSEDLWALNPIPKLVVSGKDDQFISEDTTQKMVRIGHSVKHVTLGEAGHMLIREHPAETAVILNDFITTIRSE